ncbi:hypothetical protein EG329_005025 [Mollisiaceae sp. DMI_Dod_QoI]|nr:hypothetical protein EG329_005025 [Helotiales sp. DMI_Dod_QoI]
MKLSQTILVLFSAYVAGGFGFALHNVEPALKARGMPFSTSTSPSRHPKAILPFSNITSTPGVSTRLSSSEDSSSATSYPPSIPTTGKGPDTRSGSTEARPTISLQTTAKGPETPQNASFSTTLTALGVFVSESSSTSLGTVTMSPRTTDLISLSTLASTSGGQNIVVATIISLGSTTSTMPESEAPAFTSAISTNTVFVATTVLASAATGSPVIITSSFSEPSGSFTIVPESEVQASTTASSSSIVFDETTVLASVVTGSAVVITSLPTEASTTYTKFPASFYVSSTSVLDTIISSQEPITVTSSPQPSITPIAESEVQDSNTPVATDGTDTQLSESPTPLSTSTVAPPFSSTVGTTPSTPVSTSISGVYTYAGCFTEGIDQRALQGAFFPNDANTIAMCTQECYPYKYAGSEYGRECWCGDSFQGGATLVSDDQCWMPCAGDAGEICGGSLLLSVYERNGTSKDGQTSTGSASGVAIAISGIPSQGQSTTLAATTMTIPDGQSTTSAGPSATDTDVSGVTLPSLPWSTTSNSASGSSTSGQSSDTSTNVSSFKFTLLLGCVALMLLL